MSSTEPQGTLIPTSDGLSLWAAELGGGPGTPLVLMGGAGGGSTAWTIYERIAPTLATDRKVILVNPLNIGTSSVADVDGPKWSFHARHVASVLRTLGVSDAHIAGNSTGSSIALAVAASEPDLIRSVISTGAEPVLEGRGMRNPEQTELARTAHAQFFSGDGPSIDKLKDLLMIPLEWYDASKITDEVIEVRWNAINMDGPRAAATGQIDTGDLQDMTAELGALRASVLFLYGRYDAFVTDEYVLSLADLVPRSSVFFMDKAAHHLHHERPDAYMRMIRAFIESVDADS